MRSGRPVFDETVLEGRYDFELSWEADDPKSLREVVPEALGLRLRLRPDRRRVMVLVAREAAP